MRDFGNSYFLEKELGVVNQNQYPSERIRGPEFNKEVAIFDSRADLWSFGAWLSYRIIGFWTEYKIIRLEEDPKWSKIIEPLLRENFRERPFASEIN